VYDSQVADRQNPSGRRGLPLPAPPEDRNDPRVRTNRGYAGSDITGDLPRLPEVELHDEASEVRVDPRALAPAARRRPTSR